MSRRLWISLAMLAAGSVLLGSSAIAGQSRSGGIFRVAEVGPGLSMDPQVTYYTTTWSLEYATAAKLFNFTDGSPTRLVPEVAAGYTVSKDGRTYTFPIRKGYRFSDGTKVTAKNFAYAFKRVLSPKLQSPGAQFIQDPAGTYVTSYKAQRRSFVVHLWRPDQTFMVKLTMPFFQATSTKLPLDHEVVTVTAANQIPSAGPYMLTKNEPQQTTEIRRNPYYRGRRPHHLNGVTLFWNNSFEDGYLHTLENEIDEGPLPPEHVQEVADRFGVNRSRFWAKPVACSGWIGFNSTKGPLVGGNSAMRRAISWALDRTAYGAAVGPYAAFPLTHLLPPGFPGSVTKKSLQPYSRHSNYAKARQLAAGHWRDHKIIVVWRGSGTVGPKQKDVVVRNLIGMGFKPGDIELVSLAGGGIGTNWDGNWWDIGISMGWCQDYPDPYDFFLPFLHPASFSPIRPLSPKYQRKVAAAAKLQGDARLEAFGKLDIDLMKNFAPVAAMRTFNNLFLFSNRVDPRSLHYSGVYSDWDLTRLALK